jgi:hypothetical protein
MYESKIACIITYFRLWSCRDSQTVFYAFASCYEHENLRSCDCIGWNGVIISDTLIGKNVEESK